MAFLYNFFVWAYALMINIAAPFNEKASLWVKGRKNLLHKIATDIAPNQRIIWFHSASLGEFEQGRPLIERIKKRNPEIKIFLTFFSPSGYEIRKNYPYADYIYYLPIDSKSNAKKLISIIEPEMVVFIKYEFWFNYFREIKRNNIPLYLVSGVFRTNQHFFKSWGGWQKKQLTNISYFFLQDDKSNDLLRSNGFTNTIVSGDTRFDRVSEILDEDIKLPLISKFKNKHKIICAGSSWPADEDILLDYFKSSPSSFKLIIAPHDISDAHIDSIKAKFSDFEFVLYSEANIKEDLENKQILIIDSIGLLNKVYRYAEIAYIGGGFGVAIHNLLEAAVYGIPVIYGPKHKHFREAVEMAENNGGFPINNKEDFKKAIKLLSDDIIYKDNAIAAANYIKNNTGASDLIIESFDF